MLKKIRIVIQSIFVFIITLTVLNYIHFVNTGQGRPDLIEIFCPIGGFYNLVMWLKTGFIDHLHPAGMILILAGLITTIFWMKGFCGWICPVGSALDFLGFLGKKTVGNYTDKIKLPSSLKVLSIGILNLIKFGVTLALVYLIVSLPGKIMPMMYQNAILPEDISLYKFWIDALNGQHNLTLIIIFAILILSFIIPRFWCRYLCPLGAFYGLFNLISWLRLKKEDTCISCELCKKACYLGLSPCTDNLLNNTRCVSCLKCIEKCPKHSLKIHLTFVNNIKPILYPLVLIILYVGIIGLAIENNVWHSKISPQMYARLFVQHGLIKPWMIKELQKHTPPRGMFLPIPK
ncbi:MAG: 4Fe-4S binding protein [Desulfonauticus sp.]|nr:4Fe-4S binding protein [Desulfonauticus sp.]